MPDQTGHANPNDSRYLNQPGYEYRDGRWYFQGALVNNSNDLPWKDPATGQWVDPRSGAPVDQATQDDIINNANGGTNASGADYSIHGSDPIMEALGVTPKPLTNAPGSELSTTASNSDRDRMTALLTQLQGQAQTGGGAWESALASATGQANSAATALGQSTPGLDRVAAARNTANAVAGNNQRAIGEGNILRAQTQQEARRQLGDIYGQQSGLDASQAASQAAARQGVREANSALSESGAKTGNGILAAGGQALATMVGLSRGGRVPGEPETFGDSEENDTVPAWLSPGEIVIPRSVAQSPDAPSEAAAFVAAVKNRPHNKSNFDDGGEVPGAIGLQPLDSLPTDTSSEGDVPLFSGAVKNAATTKNGALLDTTQYNQTRDAAMANAGNYLQQYAGAGPSVAPQANQNATDDTLAAAMRSGANARGMGRAASAGDTMQAAAEQGMKAANRAGETVATESTKGAAEYAQAINRQRAQDLAFAQAQQQAAWRNSMMNSGIGLAQQAALRGLLSGAGQAAASITGMLPGEDTGAISDGGEFGDAGNDKGAIDDAFDSEPADWTTPSASGDWNTDGVDAGGNAAHGGEIGPAEAKKAAEFVKALRSRKVAA